MIRYYKVLNDDGTVYHADNGFAWPLPVKNADGTWTPGAWVTARGRRPITGDDFCGDRVLHSCRADQLINWLGPSLWEIEYEGQVIERDDKCGGHRARLLRRVETYNDRTLRIFACDMAESVLHLAAPEDVPTLECAIYVARCYADGEATDEELAAAWAAAWAARAAAQAAAAAAARAAAQAAQAAARDAAQAVWAAAQAAARDAARKRLAEAVGIA